MEYVPDQKVNVEFYEDSMQSQHKSEAAGHPVFVEMPFIRIQIPGSQNTMIEVPVEDHHKKRFASLWKRYQEGERDVAMTGWKLDMWPALNTAQVKTLKHMGIHTVEQLADISDTTAQSVGPGTMELRTRANAAIKTAAGTADAEQSALREERLQAEMADLRAQLAAVLQKQDDEPARRGPGRPRVTEAA